jgi:hypothetical protein
MANLPSDGNPYELIERRVKARAEERLGLNKRLAQMNIEDDKDKIALEVLRDIMGIERPAVLPVGLRYVGVAQELPLGSAVAIQQSAAQMSAKQMILSILKAAHPEGLVSKQIGGKAQLKYKAMINPNTLSVSLSRHQADGRVRLEGKTWFYVKDEEPKKSGFVVRPLRRSNGNGLHVEGAE